jgi:(1->4)-alpha-D-glucan 1-alpha-D-glucosylmutase
VTSALRPTVRATYRVQLTPELGFEAVAGNVAYLQRLGISHLYVSPVAEATPGSRHGYDVTDHQQVRQELGGDEGLRLLWEALDRHGLGLIVDIVPNHMGIRSPANRWWQDVLRQGPSSPFASYFDIEWNPPDPGSEGKVVLPFLDRPLLQAVRDGVVRLEGVDDQVDGDGVVAVHHDDRWPLSPESLDGLSAKKLRSMDDRPKKLAALLGEQHWRAVEWRRAPALLNWRRFFDVTDLAALRVERSQVFDDVHSMLGGWLADELGARVVQGVRVDHVDGLVDPQRYLDRLRDLVGPDRLLVVEKILAADEELPSSWPVDGTTGYELVARVDEAVTDPAGATDLRVQAEGFLGRPTDWGRLELECRRLVATTILVPELDRATRSFVAAVEEVDGAAPDPEAAAEVVTELASELRVYRTYARPGTDEITDADRREVELAVARLAADRPDLPAPMVATARALLVRERGAGTVVDEFVTRFAQLSAPLAAKAVEDTAFYRAVALPWLDEVGGDPDRAGVATVHVHRALVAQAERWAGTLAPVTTHDTKRGGDVRARLSRLAARPDVIVDAVEDWHEAAARHRGGEGPDPATEWLLWLTLVGAWPIDLERTTTYATKAVREAKVHTTWTDPDEAYEATVHRFLAGVFSDAALLASLERLVVQVRATGRATSLTQLTLAATAAGAPDILQGEELWNLVLVDPDNRRPVDHELASELLALVLAREVDLVEHWRRTRHDVADDGLVKLGLWHRLLALRADMPEAFAGPYLPLAADGPDGEAYLAFCRGGQVSVVVPLRERPEPVTAAVTLPPGTWCDVVTGAVHEGARLPVAEVVDRFPVAVLRRA